MNNMKTVIIFLAALILTGCSTCVLGQIPPQTVSPDASCKAVVPDCRFLVPVTGGCSGFTITQTPVQGTIITASTTVIVKATSNTNGKFSQRSVPIIYADTITPRFGTLTTRAIEDTLKVKVNNLFDLAANMNIKLMSAMDADYLKNTGSDHSQDYRKMVLVKTFEYGDDGHFHGGETYYSRDTINIYEK
jgi:hypothetical protein